MLRPIRTAYTIPYGAQYGAPREGGRHHQGTDYHCPLGTPIHATGDGRVVANVAETAVGVGFGNYVEISYAGGRLTLDGHLASRSPLAVGTTVNSDTVVGAVGNTGNAIYASPPGCHDHHQVWINGILVDPEGYYGTAPADAGSTPIPSVPPVPPITSKEDEMITLAKATDGPAKWGVVYGNTKSVFSGDSVGAAQVRGWTKLAAIQQGIDVSAVKVAALSGEEFTAVFG